VGITGGEIQKDWLSIFRLRLRNAGSVNVQTVRPRKLAAVRRKVAPGAVGPAWGPALAKVWEFIRSEPGLRTDGHNVFL
jgi:hypothetical protein